jgi:hypothetical protein
MHFLEVLKEVSGFSIWVFGEKSVYPTVDSNTSASVSVGHFSSHYCSAFPTILYGTTSVP